MITNIGKGLGGTESFYNYYLPRGLRRASFVAVKSIASEKAWSKGERSALVLGLSGTFL